MSDFSSKQFQSSLADTVAWCITKAIGMDAESDDIGRRHALYAHAERHWEEAQEAVKRRWFPQKVTDTKQWQHANGAVKADSGFSRTYET